MAKKFSQLRALTKLAQREWRATKRETEPEWEGMPKEWKVEWLGDLRKFLVRNGDLLRVLVR